MPVTATEAPPEIDNIYLDMNGIIHNCTHANDPTLRLTETEMVLRIFMYLDKLIHIIKPKKLVFLAIDGEASHRAHMSFINLFQEGEQAIIDASALGRSCNSSIKGREGTCAFPVLL